MVEIGHFQNNWQTAVFQLNKKNLRYCKVTTYLLFLPKLTKVRNAIDSVHMQATMKRERGRATDELLS